MLHTLYKDAGNVLLHLQAHNVLLYIKNTIASDRFGFAVASHELI